MKEFLIVIISGLMNFISVLLIILIVFVFILLVIFFISYDWYCFV